MGELGGSKGKVGKGRENKGILKYFYNDTYESQETALDSH